MTVRSGRLELAGAPLDRAVDVVVGDRLFLAFDGVEERRVAREVTPPLRAATSMFLISFAKSLAELGIERGLLVLGCRPLVIATRGVVSLVPGGPVRVAAGLLCQAAADDVDEQRVHLAIPGQLGVKLVATRSPGGRPRSYRRPVPRRPGRAPRRPRRPPRPTVPDEHRVDRPAVESLEPDPRTGTSRPGGRRRCADGDVEAADGPLVGGASSSRSGQQDHAGARAVGGQSVADGGAERLEQAGAVGELDHRRRLAAGEDQLVDAGQFL